MRQHHHPLALAIVSLAITAASLPGTAYARKSLMEYSSRHASQAHGRHSSQAHGRHGGQLHQQSAGNGNSNAGPALSTFPGQGRGLAYGFGHGRTQAWKRHGGNGAGGYRPGAGVNADYLLITMRNGVKLQGNLLAQLAWSSGFALQPVMADNAGNYVVSVRDRRGSSSNDPTTLLASIKTNPNVLDASQAFMGQTRQLTAAPGTSISVAASDLIGSVAATSYQWTQLSGTPVQLAQPTDSTLSLTLPQTTTSGAASATESGTAATSDSGAAATPPTLSANRYRLQPPGSRPSLMQIARWHGYGNGYHNENWHGHEHGRGHGHGQGRTQLTFELIARDSADRTYIGKVVITVQPAASATSGGSSTDPTGDTGGGGDTSGGTGSTDSGASGSTGNSDSGATDGSGAANPGSGGTGSSNSGSGGTGSSDSGSGSTGSSNSGSGGTGSPDSGSGGTVSTDPGSPGSAGGGSDSSGSGATGTGTGGSGAVFDGSISAA